MSRLDSMLRRLTAQRDGLNWAAAAISEVSGDVLDLGLGNGRTYDHLRSMLPERRVWVIDRVLQCHPSCVPPEANFLQGEAEPMLARLAASDHRLALAHYDLGFAEAIATARQGAPSCRSATSSPSSARRTTRWSTRWR